VLSVFILVVIQPSKRDIPLREKYQKVVSALAGKCYNERRKFNTFYRFFGCYK